MKSRAALLAALMLVAATAVHAQQRPPVRGTMALEGTTKKIYAALNVIVVSTKDGIEHVIHYTKNVLVHGGRGSGVDALAGLEEGTTVVVHYAVVGADETAEEIDRVGGDRSDEGIKVTEGRVIRVDRGRKQITIRYDGGATDTLQLTERAAAEAGAFVKRGAKVTVYYTDDAGRKVAHAFTRT